MGEMICVCREIDKNTEKLPFIRSKREATDRLFLSWASAKGKSGIEVFERLQKTTTQTKKRY